MSPLSVPHDRCTRRCNYWCPRPSGKLSDGFLPPNHATANQTCAVEQMLRDLHLLGYDFRAPQQTCEPKEASTSVEAPCVTTRSQPKETLGEMPRFPTDAIARAAAHHRHTRSGSRGGSAHQGGDEFYHSLIPSGGEEAMATAYRLMPAFSTNLIGLLARPSTNRSARGHSPPTPYEMRTGSRQGRETSHATSDREPSSWQPPPPCKCVEGTATAGVRFSPFGGTFKRYPALQCER